MKEDAYSISDNFSALRFSCLLPHISEKDYLNTELDQFWVNINYESVFCFYF
jgi:hypothetical protein